MVSWSTRRLTLIAIIFMMTYLTFQLCVHYFNVAKRSQPYYNEMDIDEHNREYPKSNRIFEKNVFIIILCSSNQTSGPGIMDDGTKRQVEQTVTMLKSAVFFTSETLRFIVMTETDEMFLILAKNLNEVLGEKYAKKLVLEPRTIWYPVEQENMRNLYRPCATERLFLTDLVPYDSVIYIDTDIVFLRPPEELWKEFEYFANSEMAGLSPILTPHYINHLDVPFYGKHGMNAGIMPMNLTRLDNFPGGYVNALMQTWDEYKDKITLADQDILNILFSKYPYRLYDLSCDWNFVGYGCYKSSFLCPDAHKYGISILHGNGKMFYSTKHLHFKVVYEVFQALPLDATIDSFWETLTKRLKNIKPKDCPRIRNFHELILKRSKL